MMALAGPVAAQTAAPEAMAPLARPAVPLSLADGPGETGPDLVIRWRDPERRWTVSAATRLLEETRLNAAPFQTGGLFEAEGAVVRRFGEVQVGMVGYSARQAGEGVGPSRRLGALRWTGSAVGPVVGRDVRLLGQPATLSLRYYKEIDAPGADGDTVAAGFAFRF